MNLIEAIFARRDELVHDYIPMYEAIGPVGSFAIMLIRATIVTAEKAVADNDIIGMVKALQDLRSFEL